MKNYLDHVIGEAIIVEERSKFAAERTRLVLVKSELEVGTVVLVSYLQRIKQIQLLTKNKFFLTCNGGNKYNS